MPTTTTQDPKDKHTKKGSSSPVPGEGEASQGHRMESASWAGPHKRGSAKCFHWRQHGTTALKKQHDDGDGNRSCAQVETGRRNILWGHSG